MSHQERPNNYMPPGSFPLPLWSYLYSHSGLITTNFHPSFINQKALFLCTFIYPLSRGFLGYSYLDLIL